jgi:hypothetical protein
MYRVDVFCLIREYYSSVYRFAWLFLRYYMVDKSRYIIWRTYEFIWVFNILSRGKSGFDKFQ